MKHFAITIFSIATIAAISWINVSEAQDVQITNTPAEPVPVFPVTPPADQYFAIGPTSNSTDGNAGGVGGLNALCKTAYANDFPLARACTTVEASNTPNLTAITPIGAWVRPVIANELMVRDPKEKVWIASRTDETGLSLSQVNGDYNFISPRNTMDCRG